MPKCVLIDDEGYLLVPSQVELEDCQSYILVTYDEYNFLMDYTRLTGSEAAEYFSLGFALVFGIGYLSTYGVKVALKLIRLI